MRNRMYFGDLLVTREIKALDHAWEDFVQDEYRLMFVSEIPTSAIERIEDKRALYLEERARLKGKFSKREEESEVEDDEAFRVARGGSRWPKEVGEELFGKKSGEVYVKGDGEAFSDPLIVDDLVGEKLPEITDENRDVVKEARGFIKPVVPNNIMGKRANIPCVDEIAENFTDDPIVNAVLDERNTTKKPDTIVVFNKHDDIKGSKCDGLEEFLRRTLKEDE